MKQLITLLILSLCLPVSLSSQSAPAPLYRCPIYDGAADPVVIWNQDEKNWWMLYTARRANMESADVAYCYGTPIGAASSDDQGLTWTFRGFLQLETEWGINTFWAPEVVFHEGVYHLYVAYIRGVRNHWGANKHIRHYTSRDMKSWNYESQLQLSSDVVIDAGVYQMTNGSWRMLYKDETRGSVSMAATSPDLYNWVVVTGPQVSDVRHEGPTVMHFGGSYWLVVDQWAGLGVYRSDDGLSWERNGIILDGASSRNQDRPSGAHADLLVVGERAYIFYFTHPDRKTHIEAPEREEGNVPYELRRSVIQAAELRILDGKLTVERENFKFNLGTSLH